MLNKSPKVQSVWRAVLAGIVVHPLFILILGAVYWALRPFVWAAIYSEPYSPPPGPYSPNSGEWLFMQGISFCASIVAGIIATYWSPPKSKISTIILIFISIMALLLGQFPFDTSLFRNALYALHMPVGLLIGSALLWRRQS